MQTSAKQFATLNQRRYRLRTWGKADAPLIVMLHGWMDSSATFQFLVDAFEQDWRVVAPDWRGFGDSQWNEGSYFFPDYLADLDALLEHLSPNQPVKLLGHSMGAMIAGIYAGVRPERIEKLILEEGFGLNATRPAEAPGRYGRWLKETAGGSRFDIMTGLEEMADKLMARNPLLTQERARWLAAELTQAAPEGGVIHRADPKHKMVNPVLYRLEEAMACWKRITAPVLWVLGEHPFDHPAVSAVLNTLDERRACFQQLSEVTIAGAGHMIQWEKPEALAAAVERFFSAG
ncbi:alpha/beta fold hydrolase [Chromobacterium sp. IIBBL 290-4]|uniref:alpha/beta fold hydrolase n=1 Tax=Chromobacterium sp. IIBBL 290-4 TaxID=2953890 RepID=UPI0020B7ECBA|nr:alpha/beta hydrolase [Chromobacterium sp. IIBBL 290-4]UTH74788.1 alpha/beta hydrolase [Chromobacterium sp. IIBBL 290-4]